MKTNYYGLFLLVAGLVVSACNTPGTSNQSVSTAQKHVSHTYGEQPTAGYSIVSFADWLQAKYKLSAKRWRGKHVWVLLP